MVSWSDPLLGVLRATTFDILAERLRHDVSAAFGSGPRSVLKSVCCCVFRPDPGALISRMLKDPWTNVGVLWLWICYDVKMGLRPSDLDMGYDYGLSMIWIDLYMGMTMDLL